MAGSATAYKINRATPRLAYQVFPNSFGVSQTAAQKVLKLARKGRGTVLTPGCNTPMEMYQIMAMEGEKLFPPLLRGEKGNFHIGMIDGIEWHMEHPFSFPPYFINQVLGAFSGEPLVGLTSKEARLAAIHRVYGEFKNVFIPHLPKNGELKKNMVGRILYAAWIMQRSPIDLGIFGLGPDHMAFLGPGTNFANKYAGSLYAERVPLWGDIRSWKWTATSDGACSCTKLGTCSTKRESPEHAISITLETILDMKEIVVMAMGESKAPHVRRLLYGKYEPEIFPPHYLAQAKGKVAVLLDEAAASQL
jgi:6-phosphogluconolactonase/glucosamine-6-phosphate isomerase/deaminase